ncbi:hypothetical protein J2853_003286 [Streptosporangium lutulentum]|uniref:Uncharacterized protein n=1 Tax=Streptosporangium lutulentum TaxID=1461250 RepID=A0ABT9QBC2_9ACTN|nr:hypothetical protein [Streptosporangium lutulentum]MDP9844075.1 hypothetical protein [Streptosporangium lutulentum]
MYKLTRSLATAVATLAIAGGVIASTGGAASAATAAATAAATTAVATVANASVTMNTLNRGGRYHFDGHRFYRWSGGRWSAVSFDYARDHHYSRDHRDRGFNRH